MRIMQNAEFRMQNEGEVSGFRVQGNGCKAATIGRAKSIANCKLQTARPSPLTPFPQGEGTNNIHPSSRPADAGYPLGGSPWRRGITLMEVLISIFVLSIGLLGVAAIIPLGQLALWETAKADRCGACGRAAMREIQVSRLLDFRYWYWTPGPTITTGNYWGFYPPFPIKAANAISDDFATVSGCTDSMPFVIDPLGRAKGLPEMFGQIQMAPASPSVFLPRRTLRTMPLMPGVPAPQTLINSQLFYWTDDLPFSAIKNSTQRPVLVPTTDPATGVVSVSSIGDYSWFFTVVPAASEAQVNYATSPPTVLPLPVAQRRLFNVSVAVCYKRNFQVYDPFNLYPNCPTTKLLDGEHVAAIAAVSGFPGMGVGGGTVQLVAGSNVNVKENQWVMLYHLQLDNFGNTLPGYPQLNRLSWYRVVGVGQTTDASGNAITYISLNGPDWDYNLSAALVVVPGVIGVYNTTMELDWDPLWTK